MTDAWRAVPPLVDAHIHLFLDAGPSPRETYLRASGPERVETALANAERARAAGVTTLIDLGASFADIAGFREAAASHPRPLPRVVWAGPPITRRGGHCHFWGGEVASEADVAAAVEARIAIGAGVVKVMVSGGGLTPGTDPSVAEMPAPLLRLAVSLAHDAGLPVAAHCHATEAMRRAVDAGVDRIEHGSFLDADGRSRFDRGLALEMAARGIGVGATVISAVNTAERLRADGALANPGDVYAFERLEARRTNVARWLEAGVRLVPGSDAGVAGTHHDALLDELRCYVDAGLSTQEALRLAADDG
ncbi:MAG: amidohydrolase family protein [Chloroflexi bacterium]|nr:amidohydrolase family protein [Chloroflexota bacterium]